MKKIYSILIFAGMLSLTYCSSKKEGQEVANEFYTALKAQEYEKAVGLCHENALNITPEDQWLDILKQAQDRLGSIKSFNQKSWNVNIENGNSTVSLTFDVVYEKGNMKEDLILYKKTGEKSMKVLGYNYKQQ